MPYEPRFQYANAIVNDLMAVEGARQLVEVLPLPPDAAFMLRYEAQRRSTRYSTAIEGNTIALDEIRDALAHSDRTGSRQLQEVRNYWNALEWLERQVEANTRLSEDFVRTLHSLIIVRHRGRRSAMSEYRTIECPVVDAATQIVEYGPPTPDDVPDLMKHLVTWRNSRAAAALPAPIRAGILAYQFVTIHPFEDGNGRTARALATAELWFSGYHMRGFLSVEEEYFRDLKAYYDSLQMGLPMNYYEGRDDPDLTPWLAYFMRTLAAAAERLRTRALQLHDTLPRAERPWEALNRRQQQLLSRLALVAADPQESAAFTPRDVGEWFMVSRQTAHAWLREWQAMAFVTPITQGSQRVRSWVLMEPWRGLLSNIRQPAASE